MGKDEAKLEDWGMCRFGFLLHPPRALSSFRQMDLMAKRQMDEYM